MARKTGKLPTSLAELRAMTETEDDVQRSIVLALRMDGYEVKQTNLGKAKILADAGVPDLLVAWRHWPKHCWLGLEVKKLKGRPSPEQKRLAELGFIVIVRSIEEARQAVKAFTHELLRLGQNYGPADPGRGAGAA